MAESSVAVSIAVPVADNQFRLYKAGSAIGMGTTGTFFMTCKMQERHGNSDIQTIQGFVDTGNTPKKHDNAEKNKGHPGFDNSDTRKKNGL